MSVWDSIFGPKKTTALPDFLKADMHSHLLPALDDGSKSVEESVQLVKHFIDLGYKKIITTPHIMGDFYKNNPATIQPALQLVNDALKQQQIDMQLEVAAEYYLDEYFIEKLEKDEPLLTFGNNYVLFETSYINESSQLHKAIFLMRSRGYTPVLAHPERYIYLYHSFDAFKKIYDMDVLFQMNLNALSGYYSKQAKIFSEKMIDNHMVDFVGTDCHGERHIEATKRSMATRHFRKLEGLNLLNNSLLS